MNTTSNEAVSSIEDEAPVSEAPPTRRLRGFAALSKERVREISSKGGKVAHQMGTAHKFTREEAMAAGKKGGNAPHVRRGRKVVNEGKEEVKT